MLELDLVDHKNRYHMSIALLTHGEHHGHLIQGNAFRQLLCTYTSQVVKEEMTALVEQPALRLFCSRVSPKALEKFDLKTIAQCYNQTAPLTTYLLRSTVGLADAFDVNDLDKNSPGNMFDIVQDVEAADIESEGEGLGSANLAGTDLGNELASQTKTSYHV